MTSGDEIPAARKSRLRVIVGILLGLTLLAVAIHRIGVARLGEAISNLSYGWLFAAAALKLAAIATKGLRWGYIMSVALPAPPKAYTRAMFIGYFGNVVLVFKLGELLRLQVAKRHNNVGYSQLVGTMIFERAMDGLLLLALLVICVVLLPVPEWAEQGLLPGAMLVGVILIVLVSCAALELRLPSLLFPTKAGEWLRKLLNGALTQLGTGLRVARSGRAIAITMGLTMVVWAIEIVGTFIALHAVAGEFTIATALVVTVVVAWGLAVPAAPAGLGTHQWLFVLLLARYGVAESDAVALSLGIVGIMIACLTVIGLTLIWLEGMSSHLSTARASSAGQQR